MMTAGSAIGSARVQKFAEPLVDDLDSVLNKIMDIAEGKQGAPSPTGTVKDFSGGNAPNLTFTKLLSAEVGGKILPKNETTWNHMLIEVIKQAAAKLNDAHALKRLIIVNSTVGKKEDQGYRHIPGVGLSVQGQDAIGAWKAASHILKSMHIPGEVVFVWYDNQKAAHPNGLRLTFESRKGFPADGMHASLAHANWNFHRSQAC